MRYNDIDVYVNKYVYQQHIYFIVYKRFNYEQYIHTKHDYEYFYIIVDCWLHFDVYEHFHQHVDIHHSVRRRW